MYNMTHMNGRVSIVTGGAGFIGSNLVDALLKKGHTVFAVDNLISGNLRNLTDAKKNPKFTFIQMDVTVGLPMVGEIHEIYHLASPASVPDYQNNPEETALANSIGTQNALKAAKAHNASFLFTSTSEVYGDPKEHPQKETYWGNVNPNGIRSCYDESKRFGEMMTMLYVRKYGVNGRIARIFNTYGPRLRATDGRVISNFVTQALAGKPVTVYGDGQQTRSMCYISDMVNGLIKFMETDAARGEVINLGNPEEYTMKQLAEKIIARTGSQSNIVYEKLPQDDPLQRKPDISKARNMLSWEPTVPLDEGLTETIAYYKSLA